MVTCSSPELHSACKLTHVSLQASTLRLGFASDESRGVAAMEAAKTWQTRTLRSRNARGEGEKLRGEIIDAAIKVLSALGPDDPFSLRSVAKMAKIAAPS